jgi:hypothetical protein
MTKHSQRFGSLLLSLLLSLITGWLAGCDQPHQEIFEQDQVTLPPVVTNSGIGYVSVNLQRLTWVSADLATQQPRLRQFPLPLRPYYALATAGQDAILVICHGAEEGEVAARDAQAASLVRIDPESGSSLSYRLDNPFTGLALSAAGRWGVAYFASTLPGTNPNLLAITDLSQAPGENNPLIRSIRTLGARPSGVFFLEGLTISIPGATTPTLATKNFVLVSSDSYLTLLDLTDPTRPEISIRLSIPGTTDAIRIATADILLANDPAGLNSRLFLRSENSSDIYAISFIGRQPAGESDNDYTVNLNQLSVDVDPAAYPADIDLFETDGRPFLLATNPRAKQVALLDPASTMIVPLVTDYPVSHILIFDQGQRALLYETGQEIGYFLQFSAILEQKERNLKKIAFGGALQTLIPVPGQDIAAFTLVGQTESLYFLNLKNGEMALVNLANSAANADFLLWPGGDAMLINPRQLAEIWLIRDLNSYQSNRIILDQAATVMWFLPEPGLIALEHSDQAGALTFLDMNEPRRATAMTIRGFLLSDILSLSDDDYPLLTR